MMKYIQDNLRMIKNMDGDNIFIKMYYFMKEIMKIIKKMVGEYNITMNKKIM